MQPRGFGRGIDYGRHAVERHANGEDRLPGAAPDRKKSLPLGAKKQWAANCTGSVAFGQAVRA